jgi:hypothetical protein
MPRPETWGRYQKAVLWAFAGQDSNNEPVCYEPVEISVRWMADSKKIQSAEGNEITIVGMVHVNLLVEPRSVIWLGELADRPVRPSNLCEVVSFNDTADIKGRLSYRTLSVMRFKNRYPNLVGSGS